MVAGCVGFGNQRYFIGFLFWAMIGTWNVVVLVLHDVFAGAWTGVVFLTLYLDKFYMPLWPFGWITYIGRFYRLIDCLFC